ncbi:hypothetical protein [Halovulum sp. GXIMD14793]
MRFLVLISFLGTSVCAEGYDLSPEQLAFCLDLSVRLDQLEHQIKDGTDKQQRLARRLTEIRLRRSTLRDTARVDARAAVRYSALSQEMEEVTKTLEEAELTLTEGLQTRRDKAGAYETHCVGRSYTADALKAAAPLRKFRDVPR